MTHKTSYLLLSKSGYDNPRETILGAVGARDSDGVAVVSAAQVLGDDEPVGLLLPLERAPAAEAEPAEEPVSRPLAKMIAQSEAAAAPSEAARLRPCGDRYRVLRMIGKGGQGEVFEAWQEDLGRIVALKKAAVRRSRHDDFLKEAFTTARLDHPNIVPVYELGFVEGEGRGRQQLVLAMKRVAGSPWSTLLGSERAAPGFTLDLFLARHLPILVQVTNAIHFAHARGIIHRDIKPDQVMVGDFGEVLLLDWGLAVFVGEADAEADAAAADSSQGGAATPGTGLFTKDTARNPAGTPAYMAPEQALFTAELLGTHTDVYLLGATLYELLAGCPPHGGGSVLETLEAAKQNAIAPLPPEVPRELASLAERCLATEPSKRPATVAEIRTAIESYLSGADRRAQSVALTERVAAEQRWIAYEAISDGLRDLAQAAQLWPANPRVAPLRQRLLGAFARAALQRGDHLVAALQAERLTSEEERGNMRVLIAAAREEAESRFAGAPLLNGPRIALLAAAWLVVIGLVWALTVAGRGALQREVADKVRSLAALAARQVAPSDLRAVDANPSMMTPEFQRVLNTLNTFRLVNEDVRFIYAYRPAPTAGPRSWRVLVDADPLDVDSDGNGIIDDEEKGSPPGSIYDAGTQEMSDAFNSRQVTSGRLEDPWGTFFSGFAPVLDPASGAPVAVLGVDIKAAVVEEKLRQVTLLGTFAGGVLLMLTTAALLAVFQSRRALATVRRLQGELSRRNEELRGKDLFLG